MKNKLTTTKKAKYAKKTQAGDKCLQASWLHHQVYSKGKGRDTKDSGKMNETFLVFLSKPHELRLDYNAAFFMSCFDHFYSRFLTMKSYSELHPLRSQGFLFLVFETGCPLPLLWHRTGLRSCKSLQNSLLPQRQQLCTCLLLEQDLEVQKDARFRADLLTCVSAAWCPGYWVQCF